MDENKSLLMKYDTSPVWNAPDTAEIATRTALCRISASLNVSIHRELRKILLLTRPGFPHSSLESNHKLVEYIVNIL